MEINNDRLSRFKYYIQISIIDFFSTMGEEIVRFRWKISEMSKIRASPRTLEFHPSSKSGKSQLVRWGHMMVFCSERTIHPPYYMMYMYV